MLSPSRWPRDTLSADPPRLPPPSSPGLLVHQGEGGQVGTSLTGQASQSAPRRCLASPYPYGALGVSPHSPILELQAQLLPSLIPCTLASSFLLPFTALPPFTPFLTPIPSLFPTS